MERLSAGGFRPATVILILLVIAYSLPVLMADPLPLGDYPGHLARYHVQLHLHELPNLQRWFDFEWALYGNLGVDLLMQVVGPWLGVETAARLIAASIPPLFVAGLFAMAKAVHGRVTAMAVAASPLAYGLPFQSGLLNFCLSVSLALLAFALWIRLSQVRWRSLTFALIAPALYVCHIYGWAVLSVLAFSWQAVEAWRSRSAFPLIPLLALSTPLPLILAGSGQSGWPLAADFFNLQAKLIFLLQVLRDEWLWLDLVTLALLYALAVVGFVSSDFRRSAGLVIAAGLFAILFFLLPRILLGTVAADSRLVYVALATALLAAAPGASVRPWFFVAALAFASLRLASTTASFIINSDRVERELGALSAIPKGAALVTLFGGDSLRPEWRMPRYGHIGSYALVRRDAFANDQYVIPGANPLRLKAVPVPGLDRDPEHQAFTPAEMARKVTMVRADTVDALWIVRDPRGVPPVPPGFKVEWRSGRSAVFTPN